MFNNIFSIIKGKFTDDKKVKNYIAGASKVYNRTSQYTVICSANSLFVRTQPDKTATTCKTISPIQKYQIVSVCDVADNGWYFVLINGHYGFASNTYLHKASEKTVVSKLKAQAAVDWAVNVANGKIKYNGQTLHYGVHSTSTSGWANHHGCPWCGTNSGESTAKAKEAKKHGYFSTTAKKKATLAQILTSMCCNPFVTAAYCHGAGGIKFGVDTTKYVNCKTKRINLVGDSSSACYNTNAFKKLSSKAFDNLQAGDIMVASGHIWIYIGNNKIVEAAGGDDGVVNSEKWNNSIRVKSMSTSSTWYKKCKEVYRYIGG